MSIPLHHPEVAHAIDAHANPFKGPFPLGFGDPIFGRDQEIRELLSMLIPRRLVLLHAVSGCGKTSLLEAGVRERLPLRRLRGLPTIRFAGAGSVPSQGRNPLTAAAIRSLGGTLAGETGTLDAELTRLIEAMPRASDDKRSFACLIFDQFEEALTNTSVSEPDRLAFFKELGLALDYPDRWAIFAIRDDYLGALEPYLRYLPTQLGARMRLTQLAEAQACDAIVKLCETSAVRFTPEGATRMARELATTEGAVEPVYLQVACRYVWNKSHEANTREIGPADVILQEQSRASGDEHPMADATPVERALCDYYDEGVKAVAGDSESSQRDVRSWFGAELIVLTPGGERRRQTLWTENAKVTRSELHALQNRYLVRIDDRHGIWVELAHDRLVAPILASNRFWLRQFKQPWQDAAEKWHTAGRDQALLLVDARALADAETWAAAHQEWIAPHEREFLALSRTYVNTRRLFRRSMRALAAVALMMTVIASGAIVLALYQRRVTDRLVKWSETRELRARVAEEEAKQAQARAEQDRLTANAAMAYADRAKGVAQQAVLDAADAAKERDLAIQSGQHAILVAEDTVKQMDIRAEQTRVALNDAQGAAIGYAEQGAAFQTMSRAYELTAASRRSGAISDSITALHDLVTLRWTVATASQHGEALLETLVTVRDLLSRGLLAHERCTYGFVQSLAIVKGPNAGGNTLRYINQDGRVRTTFAPCSGSGGPAAAGAAANAAASAGGADAGAAVATAAAADADADAAADDGIDFRFPTASSFGGDGTRAVVGTALGRVRAPDATGKTRAPFYDHKHEIAALLLSPSGRYLIASSSMWSFSVRDLGAWPDNQSKPKRVYRVPAAGLSGWIQWLKNAFGETTQVVKSFAVFEQPAPASASSTATDADGLVAVGRQDAAIAVYRLRKPELVMSVSGPFETKASSGDRKGMAGHVKPVLALAFNRSGERLASGGQDGHIFVWTMPRRGAADAALGGAPAYVVPDDCNGGSTEALTFSPDDAILAAGCQDGSILLIDVAGRDPGGGALTTSMTLQGKVGEVRHLLFDPVHRRLFAAGSDTRVEEWFVPDAAEVSLRQDIANRIKEFVKTIKATTDSGDKPPLAELRTLVADLDRLHELHSPTADDRWTR